MPRRSLALLAAKFDRPWSLGLILVGGLIVSQLITLYLPPALDLYLERVKRN